MAVLAAVAAKRKSGGTDGSESKKARKVIQASIGIERVFLCCAGAVHTVGLTRLTVTLLLEAGSKANCWVYRRHAVFP